jgi:hypothetical protein
MATLAEKLGTTAHFSPLLQKAKRLGLDLPATLEALGVARGCWHYRSPGMMPAPAVSESDFSNAELAIALLSSGLPYSPHSIRVGAAMLGATGNDPVTVARLTVAERCVAQVRYVAAAGLHFEPVNPFWQELLGRLPDTPPVKEGVMPHPTRFVSLVGMSRAGAGQAAAWIRPRRDLCPAHG